ncbi:uncharacterized protein isoform X2 [Rhodnius prolixus]|uniref:uncharacterized protein isoform X2 n=1 Tax=Rhodnius prolixus TaxID=13249 RepID=UPI003D188ED7
MLKQSTNILNFDVPVINKGTGSVDGIFSPVPSTHFILQNCNISRNCLNQVEGNDSECNVNSLVLVSPILQNGLSKEDIMNEQQNQPMKSSASNTENSTCKTDSEVTKDTAAFSEDVDCFSISTDEIGVHKIYDKPVVCRAKASLPAKFLYIHSVSSKRKSDLSNWMRYVRPARNIEEQNLVLHQSDNHLYFSTIRQIKAKEELKVWYSASYARARNLTVLPRNCQTDENSKQNKGDTPASLWCCSHCRTSFKSATLLNLHVLTHAADNIETKSDTANNVINDNNIANNSFQCTDDSGKKYFCDICSKSFITARSLEGHLKFHEFGNIYECPICKVKFLKLPNLKKHIPTHLKDGHYSCPHCPKKFSAYKMIRNHIRTYHAGRKFPCHECPKCFPTSDKLRIHMLSHSELKEFLCANCGRQFKRKDKLSDHMKKFHFPGIEKPITKRARINKKIISHKEQTNTDFEPFVYKCHICVIGFKRRGMLVNHLANRHPEVTPTSVPELNLPILKANRDYYCQYCDKVYKSSSKRKAHILKNHPGEELPLSRRKVSKTNQEEENGTYSQTVGSVTANPHGCGWCHKQYASKAKLLQHQRKKHNDMLPKSLQVPRRKMAVSNYEDEMDAVNVSKVTDPDILLFQDPIDSNISDGEFIIDANTLKRALKGEVFIADCSPETLAELGQIIENRPDQYFRVYQTSTGITFARPVEVWDPLSTCQTLSPTDHSVPLGELKLN